MALKFYRDCGFEIISEEFEVPGIGPHYVMYLKIQLIQLIVANYANVIEQKIRYKCYSANKRQFVLFRELRAGLTGFRIKMLNLAAIYSITGKQYMKTIDQINFAGKHALIRVDFNVPLDERL